MLTNNAFNALLKTLEEPPAHVKFILATTEPHKLPVTILSRCQRFDFKRVTVAKITGRLREIADREGITISDASLALIARKGDGSMRDSLTAFDQVLAFCGSSATDEDVVTLIGAVDRRLLAGISAAIFAADTHGVLEGVKKVDSVGYNMRQFCQELVEHFRNLLVIRSVGKPEEILDLAEAELEELRRQAAGFSAQDIQRRLTLLVRADAEMAHATFPRLILEMALLKAATLEPVVPIQELLDKIKALEAGAVHTPALPWEATRSAPAAAEQQHEPAHRAPHHPKAPAAPAAAAPVRQGGAPGGWERFVAFVLEKDPALGSVLEHGSPLKQEPGVMEIGFPEGSYYLTSARDSDSLADIQALAREFTGQETDVRVKGIAAEGGEAPLSLVEKKKSEHEQRIEELKREVAAHPVINEALRLFGGQITDIKET
jgi:DNA polymerase-3 subunit gamma/tau